MFCFSAVLLLLGVIDLGLSNDIQIVSFTQSAPAVRPGESMSFECLVNADNAHWRVDGYTRFSSNPAAGYTISNDENRSRNPQYILSLTMEGDAFNGTRVSCYAASTVITGHFLLLDKYFIIANLHSGPEIAVTPINSGTSLQINWEEPFTHTPFNITGYTLAVRNSTGDLENAVTLLANTTDWVHEMPSHDDTEQCDWLNVSVTAHSDLGSVTAHTLTVFPRALEVTSLAIDLCYVANGIERSPKVTVTATFSDPCLFNDTQYTIEVVDETADMVFDIEESDRLFPPYVMEMVMKDGLMVDHNYSITATGSSIVGTFSRAASQYVYPVVNNIHCDTNLPKPVSGHVQVIKTELQLVAVYSCEDSSVETTIRTCQSNGSWSGEQPSCSPIPQANQNSTIAAVVSVLLVLVILFVCVILIAIGILLYKRKVKVTAPRRRLPPNSITLSNPLSTKSATNPIYEGAGPVYDTLNEPTKLLLSNTSTPSTPSVSSPRYFHMSPQLPPPRKGSVSSPASSTSSVQRVSISSSLPANSFNEKEVLMSSTANCSSRAEVEKIQASFNAEVPPNDDMYTTMDPIRQRSLSRPNKPSPLVLTNSNGP